MRPPTYSQHAPKAKYQPAGIRALFAIGCLIVMLIFTFVKAWNDYRLFANLRADRDNIDYVTQLLNNVGKVQPSNKKTAADQRDRQRLELPIHSNYCG